MSALARIRLRSGLQVCMHSQTDRSYLLLTHFPYHAYGHMQINPNIAGAYISRQNKHFSPSALLQGSNSYMYFQIDQYSPSIFILGSYPFLR